ncbi:MAG: Rieske 2Fe-2S domain-containing protein [Deltaproteobacteria bacterium]|nr:MAG: Rieske 2Fe-2S domain-containing protein [Deltaproteobacteria bacterium]
MENLSDLFRTDPDTLSGRYMRSFWHPVYVAEDLKPGWAKPLRIMSENFTLYRGETGTPHLVAFRCAHRGMQLSAGWIEGDQIRCRFHGWKYDGTGQCVKRIRSYPVREYLGLIFAYLGEGEAPDFPRYLDFEEGGELWVETYTRACSFVNNMENDPVHIPFAHRESELFHNRPIEIPSSVQAEESDWGIIIRSTFANGWVHINQRGWPNMTCFKSPRQQHRSHLTWRVPIDDDHHWSFQVDLMYPTADLERANRYRQRHAARTGKLGRSYIELGEAVLRGELRIQDIDGGATLRKKERTANPRRHWTASLQKHLDQRVGSPFAKQANQEMDSHRSDQGERRRIESKHGV